MISDCYEILGRRATIDLFDDMDSNRLEFSHRHAERPVFRHRRPDHSAEQAADHRRRGAEGDEDRKLYQRGIITDLERYNQVLDAWTHAREQITTEMMQELQ